MVHLSVLSSVSTHPQWSSTSKPTLVRTSTSARSSCVQMKTSSEHWCWGSSNFMLTAGSRSTRACRTSAICRSLMTVLMGKKKLLMPGRTHLSAPVPSSFWYSTNWKPSGTSAAGPKSITTVCRDDVPPPPATAPTGENGVRTAPLMTSLPGGMISGMGTAHSVVLRRHTPQWRKSCEALAPLPTVVVTLTRTALRSVVSSRLIDTTLPSLSVYSTDLLGSRP
mmetsp:Transcript_31768/g.78754  ORF Transcript_31768/g.78754 Transcript_31768/m.78754 type:complete len:223 (+) Transcript_31768:4374-5042(+)